MKTFSDRIRQWVGISPLGIVAGWVLWVAFFVFLEMTEIAEDLLDDGELAFAWLVLFPALIVSITAWIRRLILRK